MKIIIPREHIMNSTKEMVVATPYTVKPPLILKNMIASVKFSKCFL